MAAQNSRKTAAKRMPRGRPFQKGQSGNPGGRPKGDIQALAREHTQAALDTLTEIMANKRAPVAARIAAACAILDRGYGRPGQAIEAPQEQEVVNVVRVPLPAQSAEAWQAEVDAHLAEKARLGLRPEMETEEFMRKVWPNTRGGRPN